MVVLLMEKVPTSLRGEITRWMLELQSLRIFSTHVEMNRSAACDNPPSPNFLYARGDEPVATTAFVAGAVFSLRTWR